MNPHLTAALAQTRIADMHKAAASRRPIGNATPTAASHRDAPHEGEANPVLEACQQPLERLTDNDMAAHERQRALVCASLLLSRREDPPTHQRSA